MDKEGKRLKNSKEIIDEYKGVEVDRDIYYEEDLGYRKNNIQKGNFYKQGHGRLVDE
ncbi:hypothetical protein [Tepidibacter hydrothermalis]|uniref:Uncharacterized protein n=1 Tax=Tepidibacter hydrothermalis TaxID=3036126 RepID=A0ABY8EBX9_9FIRM|nr:hypothetical protein [Tepidibacter hydrothermalis]WFD10460.1 hypothetical protein P4S50_19725 [Tepidibacter hydrothermalis]